MSNTSQEYAAVKANGEDSLISASVYAGVVLPSLRKYEPIRSRGYALVIATMLANVIYYMVVAVALYLTEQDRLDYCSAVYWVVCLYVPTAVGPYVLRAVRLLVLYQSGKLLWFEFEQADSRNPIARQSTPNSYQRFLKKYLFWITTDQGGLAFIFVTSCLAVLLSIIFYTKSNLASPSWCLTLFATSVFAIEGGILIVAVIILIVLLWDVQDGFSIKGELIALVVINLPFLILYLVALADYFSVPSAAFAFVIIWWSYIVSVIYPMIQVLREHSRRVTRSESSNMLLEDSPLPSPRDSVRSSPSSSRKSLNNSNSLVRTIVSDPQHYQNIMTVAVECFCVENVAFCREVLVDFELACASPETALPKAQQIAEMYIKTGSRREINIDFKTRQAILQQINDNQIDINLFRSATNEISLLILQTLVPRMIQRFQIDL